MDCSLCNHEITEEQPTMTLMCSHVFHTRCMITELYHTDIQFYQCRVCNVTVMPPELLHELAPIHDSAITPALAATESFKNDMDTVIKKYKESKKAHTALHAKIKDTIKEFNAAVKPQLLLLYNHKKATFNAIKTLDEYKLALKTSHAYTRFLTSMCGRHVCRAYEVVRYIRDTKRVALGSGRYLFKWSILHKLKTRVGGTY